MTNKSNRKDLTGKNLAGKNLNENAAGDEANRAASTSPEQDGGNAVSGRTGKAKGAARAGKSTHAPRSRSQKNEAAEAHLEEASVVQPVEQNESTRTIRVGRARAAQDALRLTRATESGTRYLSRRHRWNQLSQQNQYPQAELPAPLGADELVTTAENEAANEALNMAADKTADSGQNSAGNSSESEVAGAMDMPLFPLKNVVLFPGMALPLHIFEPRYREMINRCIEEESQFGVVLIEEGDEVGGESVPHRIGTAARITKVTRQEDGRINIVAVGTQRFEILSVDESKSYLVGRVKPLPIVNGGTRIATELAQQLLPRIFEYVDQLEKATQQKLPIDRLPEDPTTLAILVGIGMQAPPKDKQKLLEKAGVPEMLAYEGHLLSREAMFLRHMVDTQHDVQQMNMGPTGYIFPN